MKKIVVFFALALLCNAAYSLTDYERAKRLMWMKENLGAVPEWNEWQQKTGELPPHFDQMPGTNLLPDPFVFFNGK
ncbi:MAG: hypothetical protein LBR34_04865, partial [Prevotella sp.]|nr:hypothetical protein [Prevotella sp.]